MFYYIFKYTWLQLPVIKTLQHVKSWIYMILFNNHFNKPWASLVARRLKRLPAIRETWVRSLGQEDPLEKEMATHSSILDWRIPWTEEPGGLQFMGSQRVGHDFTFTFTFNKPCEENTFIPTLERRKSRYLEKY